MQVNIPHSNLSSAVALIQQDLAHLAAYYVEHQQRTLRESLARMQALWLQQLPDLDPMQRALYGDRSAPSVLSAIAYLEPLLDFDEEQEQALTASDWDKL